MVFERRARSVIDASLLWEDLRETRRTIAGFTGLQTKLTRLREELFRSEPKFVYFGRESRDANLYLLVEDTLLGVVFPRLSRLRVREVGVASFEVRAKF